MEHDSHTPHDLTLSPLQDAPNTADVLEIVEVAELHSPPPLPPSAKIAPWSLKTGDRVADRYTLGEKLGVGGMGVVYRAVEDSIERDVALKCVLLREELSLDEQALYLDRFKHEARALGSLPPHPNRVVLYQYIDHPTQPIIVMEYVQGTPLDRVLSTSTPPFETQLRVLQQLARALVDVHAAGLVHRDIKPENLILSRSLLGDQLVKLIDFGIAHTPALDAVRNTQREEEDPEDAEILGTVHYLAPEVIRRELCDARADIYAMGVLFYEMVTGHGPFDHICIEERLGSAQDSALIQQIVRQLEGTPAPVEARADVGTLPEGFAEFLLTCIDHDPDQRPKDAGAFLKHLDRFARRSPTTPFSTPTQTTSQTQRAELVHIPHPCEPRAVLSFALSPSGDRVCAVHPEGHITVWDWPTRTQHTTLHLPNLTDAPDILCFTPRGDALVISLGTREMIFFDLEQPSKHVIRLRHPHPQSCAFDPSAEVLIVATLSGALELWNPRENRLLSELKFRSEAALEHLSLSPDRRLLVAGTHDGALIRWDFANKANSGLLQPPEDASNAVQPPARILSQALSAQGHMLVLVRENNVLEVWILGTGELIFKARLSAPARACDLAISADGSSVAIAHRDGRVTTLNLQEKAAPVVALFQETYPETFHDLRVVFSAQGAPCACVQVGSALHIWDVSRPSLLSVLGELSGHLLDVTFSPQGDQALTLNTAGHLDRWDLLSGRLLGRQYLDDANATRIDKDSDAAQLLVCSKTRGVYALSSLVENTGGTLRPASFTTPHPSTEDGAVETYATSPDGRLLALGYTSGEVRVYSYREPNEPIILRGTTAPIQSLAFSPNGHLLALGDRDGGVLVWDVVTAQIEWERELGEHAAHFLTFSPSGRVLWIPHGHDIELWNLDKRSCTGRLRGHKGPIRTMVHAMDGRLLLSASDDRSARLWDIAQGRCLRVLEDHPGPVTAATISPALDTALTTSGPFLSVWRMVDATLLARCVVRTEPNSDASPAWMTATPQGYFTGRDRAPLYVTPVRPTSLAPLSRVDQGELYNPRMVARSLLMM